MEGWRGGALPLLKRHFETLLSHQALTITKEIDLPYWGEEPLADFALRRGFGLQLPVQGSAFKTILTRVVALP